MNTAVSPVTVCRRCGAELTFDLLGVPRCVLCRRRDYVEIARQNADGVAQATRVHRLLCAAAEAEA